MFCVIGARPCLPLLIGPGCWLGFGFAPHSLYSRRCCGGELFVWLAGGSGGVGCSQWLWLCADVCGSGRIPVVSPCLTVLCPLLQFFKRARWWCICAYIAWEVELVLCPDSELNEAFLTIFCRFHAQDMAQPLVSPLTHRCYHVVRPLCLARLLVRCLPGKAGQAPNICSIQLS